MTPEASPWIDALRRSVDHLAGFVSGLTPEQLRAPSAATEWDVSQVLSHLGSGAEIARLGLEAQQNGTEAPANEPIWDRWNALSPEERAVEFVDSDERHISALEKLDDETRRTLTVEVGFAPEPIDLTTVVALRLSEHALHGWDVFAAFDPAAALDRSSAELLVDRPSPFFQYLANGGWSAEPGPVLVRTSDPDRTFTLTVGDPTTLSLEAPTDPIGRVDLPAEAWLRLVAGRLSTDQTPPGVTSEPTELLDRLRSLFKGF